MPKTAQLTVSVENRPGTLAHVARVLGDARVDIRALLTTSAGSAGSVHVVVDNVNRAKKALDHEGLPYTEQTVLRVELSNKPGALGFFAGKLAAKGINVGLWLCHYGQRGEKGQRGACGLRPGFGLESSLNRLRREAREVLRERTTPGNRSV